MVLSLSPPARGTRAYYLSRRVVPSDEFPVTETRVAHMRRRRTSTDCFAVRAFKNETRSKDKVSVACHVLSHRRICCC